MWLKSSIFWDITPCNPFKVNRRFRATYRLHPQGLRIGQLETRVKQVVSTFFDPEDGGDMFLRNDR
jgi:hypothetical protein